MRTGHSVTSGGSILAATILLFTAFPQPAQAGFLGRTIRRAAVRTAVREMRKSDEEEKNQEEGAPEEEAPVEEPMPASESTPMPAPTASAAPTPAGQATGEAAVRDMLAQLGATKALYIEARGSVSMSAGNAPSQSFSSSAQIWVKRPGKIHIVSTGPQGAVAMICDGATMGVYAAATKRYMKMPVAGGALDQMLMGMGASLGGMSPMALIAPDPSTAWSQVVGQIQYVGQEAVDGQPAHHLRLMTVGGLEDLWISASAPALPLCLSAERNLAGTRVVTMTKLRCVAQPDMADTTFTFAPPADAIQVASPGELMIAPPGAGPGGPPPPPGGAAPPPQSTPRLRPVSNMPPPKAR